MHIQSVTVSLDEMALKYLILQKLMHFSFDNEEENFFCSKNVNYCVTFIFKTGLKD